MLGRAGRVALALTRVVSALPGQELWAGPGSSAAGCLEPPGAAQARLPAPAAAARTSVNRRKAERGK